MFFVLLCIISFLSLGSAMYFIFIYAPVEQTLGVVQKIFYLHVSFGWWSFFSFFLVFVYGFLYLLKRNIRFHLIANVAAELGVLYSTFVLITGIIWAKASWNTYWTWDPRLITTLIMWFMYVVYLVILGMDMEEDNRATICSVLGIVAFVDVPLVFLSARMWRSIHPVVLGHGGGMPIEMIYTMLVCLFAFGLFYFCLFLLLVRYRRLEQRIYHIIRG